MKIGIFCEESQTICKAFRNAGYRAFSIDINDESGGFPQWHLKGDALLHLYSCRWDFVIAHPPCTRLANSGVLRLYKGGKKINGIDPVKWKEMEGGAMFFKKFVDYAKKNKIPACIENPIIHRYAINIIGMKATQFIQPWQFGHPESKATGLWLFNLPKLQPTNILKLPESGRWENQTPTGQNKLGPSADRAKIRAKTYPGIAEAMANQWGALMK